MNPSPLPSSRVRLGSIGGGRRKSSYGYRRVGSQGVGLGAGALLLENLQALQALQITDMKEKSKSKVKLPEPAPDLSSLKGSLHLPKEMIKQRIMANAGMFHKLVLQFCESKSFNGFILFVVLLNTAILIASTWEIVQVYAGWYLAVLDNIFLGVYIFEAAIKIYVFRKGYFKDGWNIMDLGILLFNLTDFILPLVIANAMAGTSVFRILRVFRAFRAIRALRVLRTIRFLSNIQVILTTCLQSVQSMGAIVGLILLFLFMFAVIGRGLYAKQDPERFGNMFYAIYTMFQLLTLDDWFYIYSDMRDNHPESAHIIFYLLIYIVVEYFVFLNLFVAVLVDNFQLTLNAANDAKKKVKNKMPLDDEDEDDILYAESDSDSSIESEATVKPTRKPLTELYPDHAEGTKERLRDYFLILASLEYNMQLFKSQQNTVNNVVDLCENTEEND